jgi:hypothetical protein
VRGWELVMSDIGAEAIARVQTIARRTTEISPGRYAIELPVEQAPERVLAELTAAGARLVSLTPVHETLEEFFVKRVAAAGSARPAPLEETGAHR